MVTVLAIVAGGIGAVARDILRLEVQVRPRTARPWGTTIANIGGAAVVGLLIGGEAGPRSCGFSAPG